MRILPNVPSLRTISIGAGLLALLLSATALALSPGKVSAHGVHVASEPPPNAVLEDSPDRIEITFSEPIEPAVSTILLFDQQGQEVTLGAFESFDDPQTMAVAVPDELESAIYTVIWRNLSTVDGHTWSGSFPFSILGPGGVAPTGEVAASLEQLAAPPSDAPTAIESSARWVVLLGTAIMLGGAAYVLFVAFPASRFLAKETAETLRALSRTVLLVTAAIGAFLVLEGSLLQLLFQADRLGGIGQVDELLRHTRSGRYLIARQGLLAVALLSMFVLSRTRKQNTQTIALGLVLTASFGVLLTQSLVSHAAASDGPFWATLFDVLHLLAAAIWIGALIHIGLAMPRWLDELKGGARTVFAAESFRRFSMVAVASVTVLIASGVLSAFVQFTSWDELWSTNYGWALIAKLAAMLPLLAVAASNAFVFQPRVVAAGLQLAGGADDDPDAAGEPIAKLHSRLVTTVRAEAVLAMIVLIAVAVLTQLQTPRNTAEAIAQAAVISTEQPAENEQGYITRNAEVDGLIMVLRIEPGDIGQNTFELGLGSEFGGIGEVLDARLDFDHLDVGEGGSRLPLALSGSARYTAEGSNLSLPGEWTVTATVRRRGADDVQAVFTIPLGSPESAEAESDSIWHWPFEGLVSVAAFALIAAVGLAGVGWGALRLRRPG